MVCFAFVSENGTITKFWSSVDGRWFFGFCYTRNFFSAKATSRIVPGMVISSDKVGGIFVAACTSPRVGVCYAFLWTNPQKDDLVGKRLLTRWEGSII